MKLWKVTADHYDYNTYDSFVVSATDEEHALALCQFQEFQGPYEFIYLGEYNKDVARIILDSFVAG